MTRGLNKILCFSCIHIHVSSHVQPLNKEMILKGMTRGLNKILCFSCIHIHVSSHAQPLDKEIIL